MNKIDQLAQEVKDVMKAQVLGQMSEEDSARLIILLQIEIISELTARIQDKEAA